MVGHLIFLFFLVLSPFLFSGEFVASVSHNQVNLGESVTLNLTLKEASTKGTPSIDLLKKSFLINSQQQSYQTIMLNGQITSSTTWKFILIPQKEGEAVIPSISIDTSAGTLSSQPITIQVVKGTATSDADSDTTGLTLITYVDHPKPYKNEPIFYTVRLTSKRILTNIQIQKINIEDAIVESNGEAKIYEKMVDGINVGVIEFSYLITPLKAGTLKIPSVVVQGSIPIKRKNQKGSFFDDDFDPFSMLQGFERLKPFALASEEVILEVQPAVADVSPWLPAGSLKIEEIWNESQLLQVGEPLTRTFKIVAEGIKSSQLPSLNDLQIQDNLFKIYADKPEIGDEVKDGKVKSYRKENYTLIPQQSGNLTLPEISLTWWDLTKKEKVITRIPSRTLQILPAIENTLKGQTAPATEVTFAQEPQAAVIQKDPIFYVLITGLMILLLAAIFWAVILQRRMMRLTEMSMEFKHAHKHEKHLEFSDAQEKSAPSTKKEKLPDLNPT
jgi:hypothetical protein